jgi:hypothetical protein
MNLILRPSSQPAPKDWSLQLRSHASLGPTEYYTIARVSEEMARSIVGAGAAYWLHGEPSVNETPPGESK